MLVVTTAPGTGTQGTAYPGVNYDADVPMLLSEIDLLLTFQAIAERQVGVKIDHRKLRAFDVGFVGVERALRFKFRKRERLLRKRGAKRWNESKVVEELSTLHNLRS